MIYFTINLTETWRLHIFSNIGIKKCAKTPLKKETIEQRTIFFKLKRNLKVNDESAKRI
jgi:hypothetical protein